MFICEMWLFDWYFPKFFKSDMSKYRYLEVFQRAPSTLRYRELNVLFDRVEVYSCVWIIFPLLIS